MTKEIIIRTTALFLLAGLCEIGGGYMLWSAIRHKQPLWLGVFGAILLAVYGIIATLQPANFGRTYAEYGGVFVAMSILWGWKVDKIKPDLYDVAGAIVVLLGTAIIFYAPRKA